MWWNRLSPKEMLYDIRLQYPAAKVRIFGYQYFIVVDKYDNYIGDYANTPEKAIRKAYKVVQYN